MIRRFAVAMVLALVPMAVVAPAASAGSSEWCDVDPLVIIKTPKGNLVPLFNTNGALGLQYQPLLLLAKVKHTVAPTEGGRKTLVKMEVTVPEGLFMTNFATRTKISTGPLGTLQVLAATEGRSGRPMAVQFTLNVP